MSAISSVRVSAGAKLGDAVKALLKREAVVGIPDTAAERTAQPGEKQPPSNAVIGYVMEFGDAARNIPPRPFLEPGVANAKQAIVEALEKSGAAALSGNLDAIDAGLMKAGMAAQNAVRAKITDGPFAPLSDRTIAARARRGHKGALFEKQRRLAGEEPSTEYARPLIDTGQLRASITSAVRNRGGND